MHATTHLIYAKELPNVRTSAMRNHALHLERGLQKADRGAHGSALAEGRAGSVLPAGHQASRGASSAATGRGHQSGVEFDMRFDAEARN